MWLIIKQFFIELFFPKFCVSCGHFFSFLCENCYEEIEFFKLPLEVNLNPCYLDQVIVMGKYQPPLSNLIKTLKYQGVAEIAQVLGRMLWQCCNFPDIDLVSAVPIHFWRQRERDFNQSELIARELVTQINHQSIIYLNLLKKNKNTQHQAASQSKKQRLTQQVNTFVLNQEIKGIEKLIYNQRILLVDDVITTGATLNECARILKQAGAKKVYALTIAHEK